MLLHRSDCLSSHRCLENLDFLEEKMKVYDPIEIKADQGALPPRIINGDDLLAMGFKPGPIFKTILFEVEDLQLEGEITSKEQAIEYVAKKFLGKSN